MSEDQQALWDKKHGAGEHEKYRDQMSELASKMEARLQPNSSVLEIGCGIGRDARYFASEGHNVLATDFSAVVIEQNKQFPPVPGLAYEHLDITHGLVELPSDSFDAIYAHLSLHYFDDAKTKEIFSEINRILKPSGIFAFACKTPRDKYYGEGEPVGPNMFINNGHLRHFFTESYVRELVREDDYTTIELTEAPDTGNDLSSGFISCIAVKNI
jgi:SAM-dependent methyltransferase